MTPLNENQWDRAQKLFSQTQAKLCEAFERVDGTAKIVKTSWDRAEGGGGTMAVIRGPVVEKAGANVSAVLGAKYPSLKDRDDGLAGKPFRASGVSTITHMYNPHAPIGHMNVRLLDVNGHFWVGGGADLTPMIEYPEDTKEFHDAMRLACKDYSSDAYAQFSKWCDEYFYIPHRKSIRGVGGIFFDYIENDFEKAFDLIQKTAMAYVEVFPRILQRRKATPFSAEEKDKQLYWRGRYAEYNLVYDRGTRFGLQSDGNPDAIFVSLPPMVKW